MRKLAAAAGLLAACSTMPTIVRSDMRMHSLRVDVSPDLHDRQVVVRKILQATLDVIGQSTFGENLDTFGKKLWLTPYGAITDVAAVKATYFGADPIYQSLPTTLAPAEGCAAHACTGISSHGTSARTATIHLTDEPITNWLAGTNVGRACAINTVAHEITHTIPAFAAGEKQLYRDWGFSTLKAFRRPLVSYTVGAIAECTYLQKELGLDERDLRACIARVGTNEFKSNHCGMSDEQFREEIRLR